MAPSAHARGPWDERAQHGGAAGALTAHLAEAELPEPGWQLSRMSMELIKAVPVAPLTSRIVVHAGCSTTRLTIDLLFQDFVVARAHALLIRGQSFELPQGVPGWSPDAMLPGPEECSEPVVIPWMPTGVSSYNTAVEHRLAHGDPTRPGPGAAWFRLRVPVIEGVPTSPFMLAAAVADSGSGISWVLPTDKYLFVNADLSLHIHRPPVGEWIGMASEAQLDGGGTGTTL